MSFIYNLLVALILLSSIYEVSKDEPPNKYWYYSIIVLMMLTAGLAYGLSPDWIAYWNAFEGVGQTDFSGLTAFSVLMDMEYGYILLNKLVSSLGLGYASFTVLIAVIALTLKSVTIYRYGGYVFLALLMYFIPTYMFEEHIHVRQGLANAIMIFSVKFIIERKLWKFLLCFTIAFLFHKAVVAFIFAYWIAQIKFNNVTIISLVAASLIANFIGLSTVIDGVMQYMPFGVAETYNDYANELAEGGILGDIVKIITVIAILVFNNKVVENDPIFHYFRNIYLFGVVLYFFFGNGIFASRLPTFYTVYIIFVIGRMVKALRFDPIYRNFVYTGFTIYTLLLYVNFYYNWSHKSGFGNYTTVFNSWTAYGFFERTY